MRIAWIKQWLINSRIQSIATMVKLQRTKISNSDQRSLIRNRTSEVLASAHLPSVLKTQLTRRVKDQMSDEESLKTPTIRNRKSSSSAEKVAEKTDSAKGAETQKEEVVWGKTPDGTGIKLCSSLQYYNLETFSLPGTDYPRRFDFVIPSSIPKVSFRHP
jgi:hypothetical protein